MKGPARERAVAVRAAQRRLASASADVRSAALRRLAGLLQERSEQILEANARDLEAAREVGLAAPLLKRLALSPQKLETLHDGVEELVKWPDPIGRVLRRSTPREGLELSQTTCPLGVLLIIFESRPDAVIQIGSMAMRSANGLILKGGSEAVHSNAVLVDCLRDALDAEGLPSDAVANVG